MRVTKQEFIDRMTPAEMAGILSAAKVSVAIEAWLFRFNNLTPEADGTSIDLRDPRTIAGANNLESIGLLGPGRAAEILSAGALEFPQFGPFVIGSKVRVLAPFNVAFPGVWVVTGYGSESVVIEGGASFTPALLEAV